MAFSYIAIGGSDLYAKYRPHACPRCGEPLRYVRESVVTQKATFEQDCGHLDSDMYHNIRYRVFNDSPGRTKYTWARLFCQGCGRRFSIPEIRDHEGVRWWQTLDFKLVFWGLLGLTLAAWLFIRNF